MKRVKADMTRVLLLLALGAIAGSLAVPARAFSIHPKSATDIVPRFIQGQVILQRPNTPPPHPSWVVPLHIALYYPGQLGARYTWETVTDEWGWFSFQASVTPGTYDLRVKSAHTLRNLRPNILLTGGTVTLELGLLREGDANGDNKVTRKDLALLRAAYFTAQGDAAFDPRVDFDENDRINIRDFALLHTNYQVKGDIVIPASTSSGPDASTVLSLRPTKTQPISITVYLDAGAQRVVGADVVLTYDPARVTIVNAGGAPASDVTPDPMWDAVLINRVDQASGQIVFAAGKRKEPVHGSLALFSFYVRTEEPSPESLFTFAYVDVVDPRGRALITHVSGTRVQVTPLYVEYMPALTKARPEGNNPSFRQLRAYKGEE